MTRKSVGRRMREWRHSKGLSQEDCAGAVGVTQATWSRYETRGILPEGYVAIRVVKLMGGAMRLDDIFLEKARRGKRRGDMGVLGSGHWSNGK